MRGDVGVGVVRGGDVGVGVVRGGDVGVGVVRVDRCPHVAVGIG